MITREAVFPLEGVMLRHNGKGDQCVIYVANLDSFVAFELTS